MSCSWAVIAALMSLVHSLPVDRAHSNALDVDRSSSVFSCLLLSAWFYWPVIFVILQFLMDYCWFLFCSVLASCKVLNVSVWFCLFYDFSFQESSLSYFSEIDCWPRISCEVEELDDSWKLRNDCVLLFYSNAWKVYFAVFLCCLGFACLCNIEVYLWFYVSRFQFGWAFAIHIVCCGLFSVDSINMDFVTSRIWCSSQLFAFEENVGFRTWFWVLRYIYGFIFVMNCSLWNISASTIILFLFVTLSTLGLMFVPHLAQLCLIRSRFWTCGSSYWMLEILMESYRLFSSLIVSSWIHSFVIYVGRW